MIIKKGSQLGLMFSEKSYKVRLLHLIKNNLDNLMKDVNNDLKITEKELKAHSVKMKVTEDKIAECDIDPNSELFKIVQSINEDKKKWSTPKDEKGILNLIANDKNPEYYLITEGIKHPAKMIAINNYTTRTLKDVKMGVYTYLLGKHHMVRFEVKVGYILGFYWDTANDVMFEFGIRVDETDYDYPQEYNNQFSEFLQILTFVELGDIEVVYLKAGLSNNKPRNDVDRIHNKSDYSVYVVDSSWNKLIIRTDGFPVRGHFRLQPCGHNMADRKLIWIDAFEKHGYIRRPRAEIRN